MESFGRFLKVIAIIMLVVGIIGGIIAAVSVGSSMENGIVGFGIGVGSVLGSLFSGLTLYYLGTVLVETSELQDQFYELSTRIRKLEKQINNQPKATPIPQRSESEAVKASAAQFVDSVPQKYAASIQNYVGMGSAAEIIEAFRMEYGALDNCDVNMFLRTLRELVLVEMRSGMKLPENALKAICAFMRQDLQLLRVDRSENTFVCPNCGRDQASTRKACFFCNAKFHD